MLKTVAASSLRPGMFLHSLDRRWIDHPFWKNSFLLTAADIEKIVSSGITSIVIDTDRGLECAGDSLDPVESGGEAEDGVVVFAPDGKMIGRIMLPERCANLCFGGVKRNRLFMAASQSIYSLYVEAQGAVGG